MTRADAVEQLAASITELRPGHPARVAIDGVDGFHNPRDMRYARSPDSPEGYFLDSFDYAALKRELLDPLGPAGDGGFERPYSTIVPTPPSGRRGR